MTEPTYENWLDHLAEAGVDLRAKSQDRGEFVEVAGEDADAAGRTALEMLATERGKPVRVTGLSQWHQSRVVHPETVSGD